MIISRTPLRISLGGGGTDLPGYFQNNQSGFVIAAAINKYIYVGVHENFTDQFALRYSQIELQKNLDEINHPLIRETLRYLNISDYLEITSIADIPAGTGLGSSGTFAVGLLKALYGHNRTYKSNPDIAQEACKLEIDILNEPVGKQDQFIAAVGGLSSFEFRSDGEVLVNSLNMSKTAITDFEDSLLLFYTGIKRSASEELTALEAGLSALDKSVRQNLDSVRESGLLAKDLLENEKFYEYGQLLTKQWNLKFQRSPGSIHKQVNEWINSGIENGAIGGKLIGAGGGGFLLFLAENKNKLRNQMKQLGLREVQFNFDYHGSVVLR